MKSKYQQFSNENEGKLALEMALTESSYGFEYARLGLVEAVDDYQKDDLSRQIESHKQTYFLAREELFKLDPERLKQIETQIRNDKEVLILSEEEAPSKILH